MGTIPAIHILDARLEEQALAKSTPKDECPTAPPTFPSPSTSSAAAAGTAEQPTPTVDEDVPHVSTLVAGTQTVLHLRPEDVVLVLPPGGDRLC